jgi:hypothetical protein
MKMFPKVTNTHLYIIQKAIKQKKFLKFIHHMASHVISHKTFKKN